MTTKRGETAAIVPSETKGRVKPMSDSEFVAALARERRLLEEAGLPLVRGDLLGANEKAGRIAAAKKGVTG